MYNDIKIFAADHRSNVDWNLPYIRLGNCQSDAILKITTVPLLHHKTMSEIAQAIDIKNKWKELGNPAWLGLCHYRRFFTTNKISESQLCDVTADKFDPSLCCTPIQQLAILKHMNADMICFARVRSYPEKYADKIKNVQDELKYHGEKVKLNMSDEQLSTSFSILRSNFPKDLEKHFDVGFNASTVHCCNIFTCKAEYFCQWAQMMEDTYWDLHREFRDVKSGFSHRWFAYLSERFTSIYLDALEVSGLKKLYLPLLTIDGTVHKEK